MISVDNNLCNTPDGITPDKVNSLVFTIL